MHGNRGTYRIGGRLTCVLAAAILGLPLPRVAFAQRVDDNVITNANDAFGQSVGNERVGLYGTDDVRGFNPVDAGNARIEGLYFAPVDRLPNRLTRGSRVRVGIAAMGYAFPAPTGIVDFDLSASADADQFTVGLERAQFGSVLGSVDSNFAVGNDLRVYLGGTVRRQNRHEGGNFKSWIASGGLAWRPYAGASVIAFWGRTRTYDDEAAPAIFPGGDYLPPQIKRREMIGQSWSDRDNTHQIYGALAKLPLGDWRVEAGLFRAERRVDSNFTDIFANLRPDGTVANRVMVVDGNNIDRTLSGEAKVVRTFADGPLAHRLTFSFRGRTGDRRFGGVQRISLGPSSLNFADERPRPTIALGVDDTDDSSQGTLGLSYSLTRPGRFLIDAAIAGSRYSKTIRFVSAGLVTSNRDRPVTGSLTASYTISPSFSLYGGYVRGFEEVSVAPQNATNRGAVPPAIRTRQTDLGFRYAVTKNLSLVAGVFEITKPYYNLDDQLLYRDLGSSSNRGVEVSLTGTVRPGLSVVLGNVLIDSRISGELVDEGRIGPRPVGTIRRRSIANADWRLGGGKSPLSFDIAVESLSARVGNPLNSLYAPPREMIDLGMRYRFPIGSKRALLRLQLANVFDDYGWQVASNGAFQYSVGRRVLAELRFDL
ncbi:TonB-dependent receptor domain-containing protein [Novosphingobium jiangmenense]|uniref:TonB-dependent receptor n=1 Tax=Novosphingobium jiangmenense TaxID=2791981 RepID=A0ABS0HJ93_9SPHN|nr:TonB-dependent receptor [Novosphingobium jiangmenense]MBF9152322.1 TonB-dependent receptor [Novosphingobium jiangmenense]